MRVLATIFGLSAALILLIPQWIDLDNWMEQMNFNGSIRYTIAIILLLAVIFNFFKPVFYPASMYMKMTMKHEQILNDRVDELRNNYKEMGFDFELDANVMIAQTRFFKWIEPLNPTRPKKLKFSWRVTTLKTIWGYPDGVHADFEITENQGVCGKAYRLGKATRWTQVKSAVVGAKGRDDNSFKLNSKQKEQTAGLVIVASCPIFLNETRNYWQLKKKIGVINVESSSPGAEILLSNEFKRKFHDKVAALGQLYVNLCP